MDGRKCVKYCCKRTILVQLIAKNVITCFLGHSVVSHHNYASILLSLRDMTTGRTMDDRQTHIWT